MCATYTRVAHMAWDWDRTELEAGKATSTPSKPHTSEVSETGARLESSPSIGTDGRKEMGVLGVGLLDAGLMGGNGTSPQQEATEREELSASISNHEHVGAASGCPQSAV